MAFDVEQYIKDRRKKQNSATPGTTGGSFDVESYIKQRNVPKVQQSITDRVNTWLRNNDRFVSNYNARISGRKEGGYVADSEGWLSGITEQKGRFDAERDSILSVLSQYEGFLDPEWAASVSKVLKSAGDQQDSILSYSTADRDFWKQFDPNEEQTAAGLTAQSLYGQWYKENGYRKKYEGQTYDDVLRALDTLEDGEEKDWLTSYRASMYNDEMLNYDTADAEIRLQSMERILASYDHAADCYNRYQNNPEAFRGSEYEDFRTMARAYLQYQQKFGSKQDLEKLINETKRDIGNATQLQKLAAMSAVSGNADFADKSKYVSNVEYGPFGKPEFTDNTYAYVNNPTVEDKRLTGTETTARSVIKRDHSAYSWDTPMRNRDSSYEREALEYIKPEEVAIYNYYYATEGSEKANEYLDALVSTFKARKDADTAAKTVEFAGEHPILASALSVGTSLGSGFEYVEDIIEYGGDKILGKDAKLDTNEAALITNTVRGTVSDKVDWEIGNWDAFDFVYNTVMSGVDSMASAGFGNLGGVVLGLSAAAQGTNDALERGMSNGQAFWNGLFSGVFEGLFESLSIGNFNKLKETALNVGLKNIDKNIVKTITKNIGKSMLVNASEEMLTELANITYDTLINGEFANYTIEELENGAWKQALQQVLESGASGALMGMGMSTVGNSIAYAKGVKNANEYAVKNYGGNTDALIQQGLESDVNSDSYKLAQKYQKQTESGKAMNGAQIRNLLAANQEQITPKDLQKIQKAAEERLTALGQTEDVSKVAELATKFATGQKLSRSEKSLLANSAYGARVANELLPSNIMSGDYSTEWAENIGTRNVNATAYNKKAIRSILDAMANAEDPATYKSMTDRVGEESRYSVSENGQTTLRESDEAVSIAEVVKVEDGRMTVKLTDGREVYAGDIDFADDSESYLYSAIADMENITPAAATALVKGYDASSGQTVQEYVNGIDEAYTYGYHGYSEADMAAGQFNTKLSNEQSMSAYKLGQSAKTIGIENASNAIKRMRTAVEVATEKSTATVSEKESVAQFDSKDVEVYFQDGKTVVKFDEHAGNYDKKRMAAVNYAKLLSKLGIGGKYYFFESYVNSDGVRVYKDAAGNEVDAPNGMYKESDGSIHIDLNAGDYGQGTTLFTLGHELTHFIKQWSPKKFQVLADFLIEEYGKTDMTMHERVVAKQNQLSEKRGTHVTYDEAFEEVVADAMSTMFTDGNLHEKLAKLKAKDKSLFDKIKQFFDKLIAKFRELYAELTPAQKDAQDVREMKDAFDRIQEAFAEALVEASENFQAAMESVVEAKAQPAKNSDRDFTYKELTAKSDLQGRVIKASRTVKMTSDGSIDKEWVISEVLSQCQKIQTKSATPTYYVSIPDIGKNVQITSSGIGHGFIKFQAKNGKAVPQRSLINARAALDLPTILSNSIEVNRSDRGDNSEVEFSHVLIGVTAMESPNGSIEYYAVRSVVEARKNQGAILTEANVIGKLHAINAKK